MASVEMPFDRRMGRRRWIHDSENAFLIARGSPGAKPNRIRRAARAHRARRAWRASERCGKLPSAEVVRVR